MPLKTGELTKNEKAIADAMAASGSQSYVRATTRISAAGVSKALARPAVQAEIARIQVERLFSEALPAAVDCLVSIIRSEKAPAGARVQAAKVVLDRTLGSDEAGDSRDPSEMSPEELSREIEKLTRLAADRARPVLDIEPNAPSIFE